MGYIRTNLGKPSRPMRAVVLTLKTALNLKGKGGQRLRMKLSLVECLPGLHKAPDSPAARVWYHVPVSLAFKGSEV